MKKELDEYLNVIVEETKPTIRIVVGEWGMGKDDTYYRCIKPNAETYNYIPLYISTSTLLNSFGVPAISQLINSTPNSALKLLTAIFASAIHEPENEPFFSLIPDYTQYHNPNDFVKNALS